MGAFSTLTPRQKMQAIPYSMQAQSGNAPFNVQAPGSNNSVFLNPDGGSFVRSARASFVESDLRTNGSRGSGLQFNASAGHFAAFMGSDARDGAGFVGLYPQSGGTLDGTVDIDADDDNDSANGIENGAIDIRSIGTGGSGGLIRLRNNDNVQTLLASGGASGGGASVDLFNAGTGNGVVSLAENFTATPGGRLHLKRPDGGFQFDLEPDFSTGGGAFFSMGGNTTGSGSIFMQTNDGGGDSSVGFFGSGSSFGVNTSVSGASGAVTMSSNAVDSAEIFDEPGVANNHTSGVAVPTSIGTITSRTITVPAAGFVLAIANADVQFSHAAGTGDFYNFGISTNATTLPGDQDQSCGVPSTAGAGFYNFPGAVHGLFNVSAGAHTFFFNAQGFGATATMFDIQFTLVYFPTAYGSVVSNFTGGFAPDNSNHGPVVSPMSPDQIVGERAMGEQFNQARLMKELADMQVRMESLRKQVEASVAKQSVAAPKSTKAPVREETVPAVEPVAISNSEGK